MWTVDRSVIVRAHDHAYMYMWPRVVCVPVGKLCGYVYFGLGNSIWDHVGVWMTVWLCHRMGGVVVNWA